MKIFPQLQPPLIFLLRVVLKAGGNQSVRGFGVSSPHPPAAEGKKKSSVDHFAVRDPILLRSPSRLPKKGVCLGAPYLGP